MHLAKRPKSIFKAFKIPFSFKNPTFFGKNRRTASTVSATHFSFRFSRFGVKIGFGVQKFFENFEIFFSIFFDFWPILGQKSRFLAKNAQKWKILKIQKSAKIDFFRSKKSIFGPQKSIFGQNGEVDFSTMPAPSKRNFCDLAVFSGPVCENGRSDWGVVRLILKFVKNSTKWAQNR